MGPLVEHLDVFPDLPPRWNRPFQLSTPGLATLELEGLSLDTGLAGYGLVGPKSAWSGKLPLGMAKGMPGLGRGRRRVDLRGRAPPLRPRAAMATNAGPRGPRRQQR